jgi:hypothetical protein
LSVPRSPVGSIVHTVFAALAVALTGKQMLVLSLFTNWTFAVHAPEAVWPLTPVTASEKVSVNVEVPTTLPFTFVKLAVGAVVSGVSLESLLAQEISRREGTKLTARVRMHQVNNDFRGFLLRMRDLSLRRVTSWLGQPRAVKPGPESSTRELW